MASDIDVSDLLLRWHDSRQRGQPVSAEECCAGHPDLLIELKRRIQAVEAMERRLDLGPATAERTQTAPTAADLGTGSAVGVPLPLSEQPRIPGYEVLGLLAQGGMGVVYKARQVQLKRVVALKMIRAETHARAEHLVRFKAEAEAVAQLQHPNIVQVYEVGESEGRPYFSMEFVEGGSLAQQIAGRPMPPRQAAHLVETLAEAIHFAHQRGVIHRDLKPANILLTSSDSRPAAAKDDTRANGVTTDSLLLNAFPKITDFGLAKQLNSQLCLPPVQGQTQSGVIMGTPSYMSPEQAAGKAREVGPATDIYALGAILYEMLTGRPPFVGVSPLDTLLQVMSSDPVPPSREQRHVPRDLETICLKCLEKPPARRYASAAALADDLHRFLKGMPITARSISPWRRLVKLARRRPEATALVGVLLLTALGVAGWSAWKDYQEGQEVRRTALRKAPEARRILHQYCFTCHGQDPKHLRGNLNILDHAALVGEHGLVVPGKVEESWLIVRIEDNSMPPPEEEDFPRIHGDELETLKQWVRGGAPAFDGPGPDDQPPPSEPSPLAIEVKKIFADKCYKCHQLSFAEKGLKIMNYDLLVSKRKVIVPGDPDQSSLFQRLLSKDKKKVMPPPLAKKLTAAEIDTIRRWIEEGAPPFPREFRTKAAAE
jgi:serine/threonine protein kinase